MAEKYSFFNAILKGEEYDRTYKAEDLAENKIVPVIAFMVFTV